MKSDQSEKSEEATFLRKLEPYILTICEEGIILCRGDLIWFYRWRDFQPKDEGELFLRRIQ